MLHTLGCIIYSPSLEYHIRQLLPIRNGDSWEIQLRGKMGGGGGAFCSLFWFFLFFIYIYIFAFFDPGWLVGLQKRFRSKKISRCANDFFFLLFFFCPFTYIKCKKTGCSIWCVELLRREIQRQHPDSKINSVLIDFFLYDSLKDREVKAKAKGGGDDGDASSSLIPHHRTRSIWY